MSLLDSASAASVNRGFEYYVSGKVASITPLNDSEYEGYVEGSNKKPYYVKVNMKHPKKSYCDCPHANGYTICKHMIAMYFSIFPDEAEDYKEWMESDYESLDNEYDEYDDYDRYDNYDDRHAYHHEFEKPLFYDKVLDAFIDDLALEDLKMLLKKELKNDEERTYSLYLEKHYKKYLMQNGQSTIFLDKINKKVKDALSFYDFNYNDFEKPIFTPNEIKEIKKLYTDKDLQKQMDDVLFSPKLAVYQQFQTFIDMYKENKSKTEIRNYCIQLESYFGCLKHYGIKNDTPKSNLLIVIYQMSDFTTKDVAQSLLKNAKYIEYVEFVIHNCNELTKLYHDFKKLLAKGYMQNRQYIPVVLYNFIDSSETQDRNLYIDYFTYEFLCNKKSDCLRILEDYSSKHQIIKKMESMTNDVFLLIKLYLHFDEDDKLWCLLNIDSNQHLLTSYASALKEKHSSELYQYFVDKFFDTLKVDKSRENYRKAAVYTKAISELENGHNYVNQLVNELKDSEYKKCIALFDEIKQSVR